MKQAKPIKPSRNRAIIEFTDAYQARRIFEAISKIVDEVTIIAKRGRIELKEMDASHVAMIDLCLKKGIKVRRQGRINVELARYYAKGGLLEILNRAHKGESLILKGRRKELIIEFPKSKRVFIIDQIERELEEMPNPRKLKFKAKLEVETKELIDALKDVEMISDYAILNGGFIEAIGEGGQYRKRLGRTRKEKALYSLEWLKSIISPRFKKAILRWSANEPLLVEYRDVGLRFYLAPRIESP